MTDFPEQFGDFRFWPLNEDMEGWGISHRGEWVRVILADRDACVMLADLMHSGLRDEQILYLRDTYNRADPSILVTTEHIMGILP